MTKIMVVTSDSGRLQEAVVGKLKLKYDIKIVSQKTRQTTSKTHEALNNISANRIIVHPRLKIFNHCEMCSFLMIFYVCKIEITFIIYSKTQKCL